MMREERGGGSSGPTMVHPRRWMERTSHRRTRESMTLERATERHRGQYLDLQEPGKVRHRPWESRMCSRFATMRPARQSRTSWDSAGRRSEEHTSELQSQSKLVCRLL